MGTAWDREFPFELFVCQYLEAKWPLAGPDRPHLVGRQQGIQGRRWDTIVVESTAEQLRQRAKFGCRALDRDLLRVVRHAPATWTWYRDAIPEPSFPWQYVRDAIHQAADWDLVDTRRDGNKIQFRRHHEFPDWPGRIIAIENKPDLDASAARSLLDQLERDVALGLADAVWVATRATGEEIEPILLEQRPVEVGILSVDPAGGTAEVLWHPQSLPVEETGIRVVERGSSGAYDDVAARIEYVGPAWKEKRRLAIAERVYERGWRSYIENLRPDCRHYTTSVQGGHWYPNCKQKDTTPTPQGCGSRCDEFEPEPPAWRTKDWPIEGGPGSGTKTLLEEQRRRHRPGL